jgi:hypothetical protein
VGRDFVLHYVMIMLLVQSISSPIILEEKLADTILEISIKFSFQQHILIIEFTVLFEGVQLYKISKLNKGMYTSMTFKIN